MSLEVASAMEVVENGECDSYKEHLDEVKEKVFFSYDEMDNKELDIEVKFCEDGECDENFEGNERER